jgi:hypothetical protein
MQVTKGCAWRAWLARLYLRQGAAGAPGMHSSWGPYNGAPRLRPSNSNYFLFAANQTCISAISFS